MAKVNLDALIQREDFETEESLNSGKKKETISIEDLKNDSFFIQFLRKPDFQRETNEWDADKIMQFIDSFINGDLIPAIILWRSTSGYLFIIDGSHRLSSLIAWINDDYGDGKASRDFYEGIIPDEQIEIAEQTRKSIRKIIGSYEEYKLALTSPNKVKPEIVQKSRNLGALAIQLQWVEGDVKKAETSFFKINQQASPIDPTELTLLESRRKPNCIAARAIIRSGRGHKYWSKFSQENQKKIQELSQEINEILFSPKLQNPIKTLDIPIGGKQYSEQTLPLVLEFINITNKIGSDFKTNLVDDVNGDSTICILKKSLKIAQRTNSNNACSLGLHPIIYFYSQDGRYKISSFFAILNLIMELEEKNRLNQFIDVREKFETIVFENNYLIQQITRKYRSAINSYRHVSNFYMKIIDLLKANVPNDQIINEIISKHGFNYINIQSTGEIVLSKEFNAERKSAVFIKEAITNAIKCKICNGYIHKNALTIDHILRKEDGGIGNIDNGQVAHPYCNTTYKN